MTAGALKQHCAARPALGLVAALLLLTSCAVDRTAAYAVVAPQPTQEAVTPIEPTPVPPPPTAAVIPTSTPVPAPTATPVPEPTPTTEAGPAPTPSDSQTGPNPIPTRTPDDPLIPEVVQPGLLRIPVGVTSFVLADPRPLVQIGGHTLIYVDDQAQAEVDIFTPYADRDGTVFAGYDAVIDYLETDPVFAGLAEIDSVTIAGLPTRVFNGTAEQSTDREFYTDAVSVDQDRWGWFAPVRMQLWVIDEPSGTIIVSAESLEDPGQFSEAIRLASEVLSTITFG